MYFEMIGESSYNNNSIIQEPIDEHEAGWNHIFSIVTEAYYGKTPEIKKIEEKIGEIRTKYATDQMKTNTAKEKEELEDLFCEAFGFACCSIHVDPSALYNACTIPISSSVLDFRDLRKHIVSKNGKGLKYKKEANIYLIMRITKGLLFSTNFTDAEVTAILLHEVGHNFQTAMSGTSMALNNISKALGILYAPIVILMEPQAGPFRNKYTDIIKAIDRDFKGFANAYHMIKNIITSIAGYGYAILAIIGNISSMLNPVGVFQQIPKQLLMTFLTTVGLDPLGFISGVKDETVADAFCSAYGYGVELSSALKKIEKASGGFVPDQIFRDGALIGSYFDLIMLPSKIISNAFDPHPNTIARIDEQQKYLSEELLRNEKNPKMKKELQKQISEINKIMDKYLDAEDSGFFFSNAYDKILLMLFGGDLRSTILAKGTNDEFDKAQERAEQQLKEIKSKR